MDLSALGLRSRVTAFALYFASSAGTSRSHQFSSCDDGATFATNQEEQSPTKSAGSALSTVARGKPQCASVFHFYTSDALPNHCQSDGAPQPDREWLYKGARIRQTKATLRVIIAIEKRSATVNANAVHCSTIRPGGVRKYAKACR